MRTTAPLILASGSPRRKELLRALGLEFQVVVREVDESFPTGMGPVELARHLARIKAEACSDLAEKAIVITADTVVALKGQLLGKPADATEARRMLRDLSGHTNQVITGVCIRHREQEQVFHAATEVHFRELQQWEIDHYVEQFRPFDKAGAYGIQEWIGMVGISAIEGDYYNVVGLPVGMVWEALKRWRAE